MWLWLGVFICGIGFVWNFYVFRRIGADFSELLAAPLELAGEARFVTKKDGEGRGVIVEPAEGERGAGGFIGVGLVGQGDFTGHVVHLVVEQGRFHSPGALEAPTGDRHFLDDQVFDAGGGSESRDEGLVQLGELGAVFVAETNRVRGAVR